MITPEKISQAFRDNEFCPWFQPIFSSKNGQLIGCEVLARWKHPKFGMISPEYFIPIMELTGLNTQLTSRLMRYTADLLMPFIHLIPNNFTININISSRDCLVPDFEQQCMMLLEQLGRHKVKLVLELTERTKFSITAEICATFKRLKERNIYFALDDFGTGYATYEYLQYFPLDIIKLDKSFVQHAISNKVCNIIVNNIVGLANELNIDVISEGIETYEQADLMTSKGIKYLQGYFLSPPLSPDIFINEWICAPGRKSFYSYSH